MSSLDPNLMAYLQCSMMTGADPATLIEMQANYLRMMANSISEDPSRFNLTRPMPPMMPFFMPPAESPRVAEASWRATTPFRPSSEATQVPWQYRAATPDMSIYSLQKDLNWGQEPVLTEQNLVFHKQQPATQQASPKETLLQERLVIEKPAEMPKEQENAEPEEKPPKQAVGLQFLEEDKDQKFPKAELLKFSPPRAKAPAKPYSRNTNAKNLDEIPLKGVQNFEMLLEEKLSKEGGNPSDLSPKPKKEFLKRKTQKSTIPKQQKKPEKTGKHDRSELFERSDKIEKFAKQEASEKQHSLPEFSGKIQALNRSEGRISMPDSLPDDELEESQDLKAAKPFLKRGAGQLCTQQNRAQTPARLKTPNMKRSSSTHYIGSGKRVQGSTFEDDEEESYKHEESKADIRNEELLKETQRVRAEADRLKHLRADLEIRKRQFEQEVQEFYRKREADLKEREAWKEEELKKMRKERKAMERTGPSKAAQPQQSNKKDKEEIEHLQQTVHKLIEEMKQKELRHKLQTEKMRKTIEELKGGSARVPKIVETVVEEPGEEEEDKRQATRSYSQAQPSSPTRVASQKVANDGKIQKEFEDGHREVLFPNGVKREIYPDGYTVVYFTNKDVKQSFPDGKVIYYFAEVDTQQTTFPDGQQLYKFANGQIEQHFPDGTKEIKFPDGTVKCIFPDGEEESIFPDGTVQKVDSNGVKYIDFVNGQKDTIFPDGTKIREFTDGRVRKILPDGRVIES
mmetsp:Transcript_8199/g.16143  ORF Transcript_8199/g.16143 Transcript_8199/m.16143 type:complete len:741 (-) Transcript_8199:2779-5001(-)